TVQDAIDAAQAAKDAAQIKVNAVPEDAGKADFQERLDALEPITVPEVTDSNGNGIDDADTAAEAAAELGTEAETAQQAAENLLAGLQKDGLITPEERQQIQDAADAEAEAKDTAQDAVTALPESADKEELQDRLDNLEGISVPPVTDADGNGKDDAVEAAEALVQDAEDKQQAAEDLLNQAQEDGLITSEEQAQLQDAADAAAEAKDTAQDAVTALPESADKEELQDRLDAINDPITVPPVNDADGNGIDDAFEAAEALVTD